MPLALDQAGAYLEETGCSLEEYASLWGEHSLSLMAERGQGSLRAGESLVQSWSLSLEQLGKAQPAAVDLLRLFAYLHCDGLPEGPISSRPGLKSVAQIRIPKGESYARVEGPRGEVGCYLVADGSPKPYRMKWRGASFSNLAVLPHIIPGHQVAHVVAIMGSVDPVFGEVDR